MTKVWRQALERAEKNYQKRMDWEEKHPPITQIGVIEADSKRKITPVGEHCVKCDLPCNGLNIPSKYGHRGYVVNTYDEGITVPGFEESESGGSAFYLAVTCGLTKGKICIRTDERLRKAVEG
jgi:hypothetical protein